MIKPTLVVENLKTFFFTRMGVVKAVDGVSFSVLPGKILGLVGESGSGKTVTGLSILGLVDPPGKIVGGKISLKGKNIVALHEEYMRRLRGSKISMIFQDAMTALHPLLRIDTQIIEALRAHQSMTNSVAIDHALNALMKVGIPDAQKRLKHYPHQLSGGMRQRVAIAIAMLHQPDLIIADEPTTALDVTIQAQILYETKKLCKKRGTSLIWITHDLSLVAGLVDEVCVMYAGKFVESGKVDDVLDRPLHPYTMGLIDSLPSRNPRGKALSQISGMPPSLLNLPSGCAFRDRCPRADKICEQSPEERIIFPGRLVSCFHPCLDRKV